MRSRFQRRTWRVFDRREGRAIGVQLGAGRCARCPRCGDFLEARPTTRLATVLPDGAGGYDLDCRGCRKFLPRVRHTHRSVYYLRVRRLAAAVLQA